MYDDMFQHIAFSISFGIIDGDKTELMNRSIIDNGSKHLDKTELFLSLLL